jgi:hypothetical protein
VTHSTGCATHGAHYEYCVRVVGVGVIRWCGCGALVHPPHVLVVGYIPQRICMDVCATPTQGCPCAVVVHATMHLRVVLHIV